MHNFSDDLAVQILKVTTEAMTPGYSKVLIDEYVLADRHPHPQVVVLDIQVTMFASSAERSEEHWRRIVERAGLRLVKIWQSPDALSDVVGAELPL